MRLISPEHLDRTEWLSTLGVKGEPGSELVLQMQRAEEKLLAAASPQGVYRIMERDDLRLAGKSIKRHLFGCKDMIIMAVTLGVRVDALIRSSQIRDMAEAVLLDCGASVLVEQICDAFQQEIKDQVKSFMTGRFSPGYGDLPLELQAELLQTLDALRKIGLTITADSHMMTPRKSVTAIIGIADQPVEGDLATCSECVLKDTCQLRKEGKTCGSKA